MKLKVLGTLSPYPKKNANGPGFYITHNKTRIVLDCGSGISRLLDFPNDLENLHIIISHLHKDHYSDLFNIGYTTHVYKKLGISKSKVNVYLPKYVSPDDEAYSDYLFIKQFKKNNFDIHEYDGNSILKIDDLEITFLQMVHEVKTYACKIKSKDETLVYTADTGYDISPRLVSFAHKADLLICESSFIKEHDVVNNGHLHAYQSATIAKDAEVKRLLLTHFWPETDKAEYEKEAKEIYENVEAACEGKEYDL